MEALIAALFKTGAMDEVFGRAGSKGQSSVEGAQDLVKPLRVVDGIQLREAKPPFAALFKTDAMDEVDFIRTSIPQEYDSP